MTRTSHEAPHTPAEDEKQEGEQADKNAEQAEIKEETQQSLEDLKTSMIPDIAKKLYERFVKKHTEEKLEQQGITVQTIQEQLEADLNTEKSDWWWIMSWISRGPSIWWWMNKGFNVINNLSMKNISLSLSRAWERLSGSTKDQIDNTIKEIWKELLALQQEDIAPFMEKMGIKKDDDPKKDPKKDQKKAAEKSEENEEKEQKKEENKKSEEEKDKEKSDQEEESEEDDEKDKPKKPKEEKKKPKEEEDESEEENEDDG